MAEPTNFANLKLKPENIVEPDFATLKLQEPSVVEDVQIPTPEVLPQEVSEGLSLGEQVIEAAPEVIGGTIGSVKAVARRTPIGAIASGVGSVIGEQVLQTGQALDLLPGQPPETFLESIKRQAGAFTRGAVGETVGRGVGKLVSKIKIPSPFTKTITPEGAQALKTIEETGRKNLLLPAQVTEQRGLDLVQNALEKSFGGGAPIRKARIQIGEFNKNLATDTVRSLGDDIKPNLLAEMLSDSVDAKLLARRLPATKIYTKLGEDLEGIPFHILELKAFVKDKRVISNELKGFGADISGADFATTISQLDDQLSYKALKHLRTTLRVKADALRTTAKKAPAIQFAKDLDKEITKVMGKELKDIDSLAGTDMHGLWKQADQIWASTNDRFKNEFVKKLLKDVKKKPDRLARALFQPENQTQIKSILKAVDSETKQKLRRTFLENTLNDSLVSSPITGKPIVDGDKFANALFNRKTGLGKETVDLIYGKKVAKKISEVSNLLKVSQQKQSEGTGSLLIQIIQGSALAGAVGSIAIGSPEGLTTAGVVLLTPAVLGRMMTSPKGIEALLQGLKFTGKKAGQRASLVARIGAIANKEQAELEEEE